jgi:hypothetical protein
MNRLTIKNYNLKINKYSVGFPLGNQSLVCRACSKTNGCVLRGTSPERAEMTGIS